MAATSSALSGEGVQRPARRVAHSTWGDRALRAGLAARGVVFLVLAYLVFRIALGALGRSSTPQPASLTGVPQTLAAQTGGRVVLFVLAIGLALYALFSLVDAALHHDDESPGAKRWGDRLLSLFGFVMYGVFSVYSFTVSVAPAQQHQSSGKEQRQKELWTAHVLRWPGGPVWLALLGITLLVIFGFLVRRALSRTFRPRLERKRMTRRAWRMANVLGTAGYLGRAALFGIVGGCILAAAIQNDPQHGQGVNGSLRIVAGSSFGAPLLGLVAALLLAYGLYMFFETRYRRV